MVSVVQIPAGVNCNEVKMFTAAAAVTVEQKIAIRTTTTNKERPFINK